MNKNSPGTVLQNRNLRLTFDDKTGTLAKIENVLTGEAFVGGLFLGVELPLDQSSLSLDGSLTLGYAPNLKVDAGERVECEPIYMGVYQRSSDDVAKPDLPLRSEFEAMVRMTSIILGPPRCRFVPMANGWWSEMNHGDYRTTDDVEADLSSVDFILECGIDWLEESHPWCGDSERVGALVGDAKFQFGPLSAQFIKKACQKGIKVILWATMNHSNPFVRPIPGPLRLDKPEWLIAPVIADMNAEEKAAEKKRTGRWSDGNCLANKPFFRWLTALNLDAMQAGPFDGWAMDGDWFTWDWDKGIEGIRPANCTSTSHDHLPGDANYACQRALGELTRLVRERYPDAYIHYCRPPMDLGVWSLRWIDACFTIDEFGKATPLKGMGAQPKNITCGDKIRVWSRIRVHRHFFPHWLDQPQVFGAPKSMGGTEWESEGLDYILLSAISSSPNLLFYLPTKAGIPEKDKQIIRKWLDWGRANVEYLMVRKDLPDWPEAGKVDGSAHVIGENGFVFFFNPNAQMLSASFFMDESIGLKKGDRFEISENYPEENGTGVILSRGEKVEWQVPGHSAVLLRISPRQR